jgi:hypothetical protein
VTGRRTASRLCIHFGMLCAALAFASWWTSHTILDVSRTRRVTETVLSSEDLRHYLAGRISTATAPAIGATAARGTGQSKLAAVLARRDMQLKLEHFVVDVHERLLGQRTQPPVLNQATVRTLVSAAFPSITAAELAKVHEVRFNVPQSEVLLRSRETLAHRFWLYLLGAVALLTVGLVTTDDRKSSVKLIGKWLIGITLAHLLVLWFIPVVVLPNVTTNPWAHLVGSIARALGAGIVTGLVVLALVGVVFLFVDLFIPSRGEEGLESERTEAARAV